MSSPINPAAAVSGVAPSVGGEPVARREVSMAEVDRFEAAMTAPTTTEGITIEVQRSVIPQQDIGQVLMQTVDDMRAQQVEHVDNINAATSAMAEDTPMQVHNLFSLQFELMQMSFQHDLTAKVADKLSQGAQTLFRNQ